MAETSLQQAIAHKQERYALLKREADSHEKEARAKREEAQQLKNECEQLGARVQENSVLARLQASSAAIDDMRTVCVTYVNALRDCKTEFDTLLASLQTRDAQVVKLLNTLESRAASTAQE